MKRFYKCDPDVFFRDYKEFIIGAFRRGDNSSFEGVYRKLSFPLTAYAKKIVNCPLEAQDIVANAFHKLLLHRKDMKSYKHLQRWMYVTVRNEAIDYLRSQAKQRKGMEAWYYLSDYSYAAVSAEKEKTFLLRMLFKAIDELPTQRQKVLRLYFFDKKDTHEIAAMLGLRPQTVLNHKAKALELLRRTLPFLNLVPANYL